MFIRFRETKTRLQLSLVEKRALQLENAEADERFWSNMQDMNVGTVEDHKRLVANAERAIAGGQSAAADAAGKAAIAKERVERIKKGENVEGGPKPFTSEDYERILRDAGWTKRDIEDSIQVAQVSNVFGFEAMMEETHKARERSERNVVRKLYRRIKHGSA
jgi:hypothetical protein